MKIRVSREHSSWALANKKCEGNVEFTSALDEHYVTIQEMWECINQSAREKYFTSLNAQGKERVFSALTIEQRQKFVVEISKFDIDLDRMLSYDKFKISFNSRLQFVKKFQDTSSFCRSHLARWFARGEQLEKNVKESIAVLKKIAALNEIDGFDLETLQLILQTEGPSEEKQIAYAMLLSLCENDTKKDPNFSDKIFETLCLCNKDDKRAAELSGKYYAEKSDQASLEKAKQQYKIVLTSNSNKEEKKQDVIDYKDYKNKFVKICSDLAKLKDKEKDVCYLDAESYLEEKPTESDKEIRSKLAYIYAQKKDSLSKALKYSNESIDEKKPSESDLNTLKTIYDNADDHSEQKMEAATRIFDLFSQGKISKSNTFTCKFIVNSYRASKYVHENDFYRIAYLFQAMHKLKDQSPFIREFLDSLKISSETLNIIVSRKMTDQDLKTGLDYLFGLNNTSQSYDQAAEYFSKSAEKGSMDGHWWHAKTLLLLHGADAWLKANTLLDTVHKSNTLSFLDVRKKSCIYELSQLLLKNTNNNKNRPAIISTLKAMCKRQLEKAEDVSWLIQMLTQFSESIDASFNELLGDCYVACKEFDKAIKAYKTYSSSSVNESKTDSSVQTKIANTYMLLAETKKENEEYYAEAAKYGNIAAKFKLASLQKGLKALDLYENAFNEVKVDPKNYRADINSAKNHLINMKTALGDNECNKSDALIMCAERFDIQFEFSELENKFFDAALYARMAKIYKSFSNFLEKLNKVKDQDSSIQAMKAQVEYYLGFISKDYLLYQTSDQKKYSQKLDKQKRELLDAVMEEKAENAIETLKKLSEMVFFSESGKFFGDHVDIDSMMLYALSARILDRTINLSNAKSSFKEYLHPFVNKNLSIIVDSGTRKKFEALDEEVDKDTSFSKYKTVNEIWSALKEKEFIKAALKKEGITPTGSVELIFYGGNNESKYENARQVYTPLKDHNEENNSKSKATLFEETLELVIDPSAPLLEEGPPEYTQEGSEVFLANMSSLKSSSNSSVSLGLYPTLQKDQTVSSTSAMISQMSLVSPPTVMKPDTDVDEVSVSSNSLSSSLQRHTLLSSPSSVTQSSVSSSNVSKRVMLI